MKKRQFSIPRKGLFKRPKIIKQVPQIRPMTKKKINEEKEQYELAHCLCDLTQFSTYNVVPIKRKKRIRQKHINNLDSNEIQTKNVKFRPTLFYNEYYVDSIFNHYHNLEHKHSNSFDLIPVINPNNFNKEHIDEKDIDEKDIDEEHIDEKHIDKKHIDEKDNDYLDEEITRNNSPYVKISDNDYEENVNISGSVNKQQIYKMSINYFEENDQMFKRLNQEHNDNVKNFNGNMDNDIIICNDLINVNEKIFNSSKYYNEFTIKYNRSFDKNKHIIMKQSSFKNSNVFPFYTIAFSNIHITIVPITDMISCLFTKIKHAYENINDNIILCLIYSYYWKTDGIIFLREFETKTDKCTYIIYSIVRLFDRQRVKIIRYDNNYIISTCGNWDIRGILNFIRAFINRYTDLNEKNKRI